MTHAIEHAEVVMVEETRDGQRVVVNSDAAAALERLKHLAGREGQPTYVKGVGKVEAIFPARTVRIYGPDLRHLERQLGLGPKRCNRCDGLLIGNEIREALAALKDRGLAPRQATLVGVESLVELYAHALDRAGIATGVAGEDCSARGLFRIAQAAQLV